MEYFLIIFLVIVIGCLLFRIRSLMNSVHRTEVIHKTQLDHKEEIISLLRADMAALCGFTRRHVALQSQEEFRFYFEIYGAADFVIPDDIYFVNYYMPVKGSISESKPYGDFTVYISANGSCYHSNKYCSSTFNSAAHIYDVAGKYRPCPKCALKILHNPPKWYTEIKRIMDNSTRK